jgi:hypothetical protein
MNIIKRAVVLAAAPVLAAACIVVAMGATPARAQASGEACVINAPNGAPFPIYGAFGHVGWAFEVSPGQWEYGANEGAAEGGTSDTWINGNPGGGDSWETMLYNFTAIDTGYTTYRCTSVASPNPGAADDVAQAEYSTQYWSPPFEIPGNDCESQVYNVLTAYGVSGLPTDGGSNYWYWIPNNWYSALTGFSAPASLPPPTLA